MWAARRRERECVTGDKQREKVKLKTRARILKIVEWTILMLSHAGHESSSKFL
jgi:hypothetical protein